ncbi:MAG TPA: ATP-binding protein [Bacillota bacterium]|nr:ATP-binding protein [Bacillota bacterium]HPX67727.1 ATP-binding protein [Bacillota bacterium]HQA65085.1 ATP-binding protein [Bacillota bacterium]HQO42312.1 ATP-binding protein [Bacillota bacterium]HQQ44756.1 ATP-binding protein [Bacillota bacterium]
MFKSIQWKLVIISFLLVWLAMSIVGVFITEAIKKEQIDSMTDTIITRGYYLADNLKDKIGGASNIQEIVSNWFVGQGKQVRAVFVYENGGFTASQTNYEGAVDDLDLLGLWIVEEAIDQAQEITWPVDNSKYLMSIAVPIISSNNDVAGAIYISADLFGIEENIMSINKILTSATILALCITALLGNLLSRTFTGPIKEVTSKAERLAKGDFGQTIAVKSRDEVGQLTEMFNYLTVRLKSTLDEMSREKNKVEAILTNMTDGIIAVNAEGVVIHANPAAYKIFNIREEDLYNRNFDDAAEKLDLGITFNDILNDSDNNYNILSINNLIIKISVVQIINEHNKAEGAMLVLQDVTEQEKLDKMRKEFVANVSHELRTPLTTIRSYTETLLDGALDNKEYTLNFLKVINSESERMTRLVKDLLQLSKLDYDKMEWNMKSLSILNILRDCVVKMEMAAKQKNQSLSFEAIGELCEINGDKDRIEQVIINIISNAIKYTPENGSIKVTAKRLKDSVEIRIADSGIGIPKDDLPRLFERFYRVDKARSRSMGGTGLGLSIAKNIVEAHKGSIRIESEYGKGSEVIINFPCEESLL